MGETGRKNNSMCYLRSFLKTQIWRKRWYWPIRRMDYYNEQRLVKNKQNNMKTLRLYLRVEGQEKYNLAALLPGRFHVNKLQRGSLLSYYIPRNKIFLGARVVKNLPASSGMPVWSLVWEDSTNAVGQLSPCSTTIEAPCPRACTPQLESSPSSPRPGKALAEQSRPSIAKNSLLFLKKERLCQQS